MSFTLIEVSLGNNQWSKTGANTGMCRPWEKGFFLALTSTLNFHSHCSYDNVYQTVLSIGTVNIRQVPPICGTKVSMYVFLHIIVV